MLSFAVGLTIASLALAQNDLGSAIQGQEDLSTLAGAITGIPGLLDTLSGSENITILAPTNEAFESLEDDSPVAAAIASNDTALITAVLQYHVLNGSFPSSDISETPAFAPTLLDNEVFSNVTGGQVVEALAIGDTVSFISGVLAASNVTEADIQVGSITIHKINRVLTVPMNVSSTAIAAGFSAAAGALTTAELVETVDTARDVTIFVPSNDAFQAAASAFESADIETLQSVLQYHVVADSVVYSSDITNTTVQTLGGGEITLSVVDGTVFVNSARVIIPNVLVANGVVHVIGSVLNPNNTETGELSPDAEPTPAFSGASSAESVPFTSGIPEATATPTVPGGSAAEPTGADESGENMSTAAAPKASAIAGAVGMGAVIAGALLAL